MHAVEMLKSRSSSASSVRSPQPYCQCPNSKIPPTLAHPGGCACGEYDEPSEWRWEEPSDAANSWVVFSPDHKQVTFHPVYSSGTAAVKGDTPLLQNYHYYWEVKMLTEPYGTDIMIGIGSDKVNLTDLLFQFVPLLGRDGESYGLSYKGALRHNALVARESAGFCRGSIVGVMVDMWQGTMEFFVNRQPQGLSFYNLRRHQALYPIISSTAAQSSMRLIYAASWQASLLVDAAKTLAASVSCSSMVTLPPGLRNRLKSHFWLTLPNKGVLLGDEIENKQKSAQTGLFPSSVIMNGFYVDNVERDFRIVLWQ